MSLCISAIGMVTNIGMNVRIACASVHAGLMMAEPLEHWVVATDDDADPVNGCPVSLLTDGCSSVVRWLNMGYEAVKDLCQGFNLPQKEDVEFWRKTALVCVTPSLDAPNFEFEGLVDFDNVDTVYMKPLSKRLGLPIDEAQWYLIPEDGTGTIQACRLADALFTQGLVERALVIVADSYIDAHTLQWMNYTQRLKTSHRPNGLIPGESAVALLFEREDAIVARQAQVLLRVLSYDLQFEQKNLLSDDKNVGEALGLSMQNTLSAVELDLPFQGDLYSDLNGEDWRTEAYALARLRVPRSLLSDNVIEHFPAESLGDIGVVHVACSLCLFIRSQQCGYAKSPLALIVANAAVGPTGSMLVGSWLEREYV